MGLGRLSDGLWKDVGQMAKRCLLSGAGASAVRFPAPGCRVAAARVNLKGRAQIVDFG
jgi:hypothetical protein